MLIGLEAFKRMCKQRRKAPTRQTCWGKVILKKCKSSQFNFTYFWKVCWVLKVQISCLIVDWKLYYLKQILSQIEPVLFLNPRLFDLKKSLTVSFLRNIIFCSKSRHVKTSLKEAKILKTTFDNDDMQRKDTNQQYWLDF
jgi:hypothetical protein